MRAQKMEFLQAYDRPDLVEAASANYDNVVGVFAQLDTWDVHLLVLIEGCGEGHFEVLMIDCENAAKGRPATREDMVDVLENGWTEDEAIYGSLGEALDEITGGYGELVTDNPRFQRAYGDFSEAERVANMSKYQRKVYLREKTAEEAGEE